ncbi:MAG: ketopantoate reductase family protein [Acidimicrobiales bacterium]
MATEVQRQADSADYADYVVHGAGGIGSVVAGRLAGIGRAVTVIVRGEHRRAMAEQGLTLRGMTESRPALSVIGHPDEAAIGPDTVVILAMKTNDTAAALDDAGDRYQDLPVLCFQNGVANEDIVAERGLRAYGCVVMVGGRILEPGVVVHTAGVGLPIGVWPSGIDTVTETVVADLVAAGMDASAHTNIAAAKWGKLFRNLNNAYLALADLAVQQATRFESHRLMMADVQDEALDVLEAAGIELDTGERRPPRSQVANLREPGEWHHVKIPTDPDRLIRPSTWQDLHFARGQVEVDWFNGEIVRIAERLGRDAPLNRVMRDRCVDAATRRLPPGSETAASLRAAAALSSRP